MKYTIAGFLQKKLIEYDLTIEHALILRWFIDFKATGQMSTLQINQEEYYWVNYQTVLENLPILGNCKKTIYRRFKTLIEKEILTHQTIKTEKGSFSYYGLGKAFNELQETNLSSQDKIIPPQKTEMSHPVGQNCPTKDTSIKETSINKKEKYIKEKKVLLFDFSDFFPEEKTAIEKWIEYRKEIKKPYKTQGALTYLRNRLLDLRRDGHSLVQAIDYSKGKEYVDVYNYPKFIAHPISKASRLNNNFNGNFAQKNYAADAKSLGFSAIPEDF